MLLNCLLMMTDKADKPYWREVEINKQPQRWNYRSEFVGRLGLDKGHGRIWLSFGLISIIGLSAFVVVKSQVINSRRRQMEERERVRKQLIERSESSSPQKAFAV